MSKVIGIMGESGSGKTTAMRTLDPKSTFYIDCDGKGLSWKGWRDQYNTKNMNFWQNDVVQDIQKMLVRINTEEKFKRFKVVVIDTLNGIMVTDEVRRMKEKNFDKWVDLAQCVWGLLDQCHKLRDDLTVILICHSQTQKEDDGYTFTRIKTSGKKLDKLCIESKLTTVLHAEAKDGEYIFRTKAHNSTCKTPMGAFDSDEIPNDMAAVLEALKEY